MRYRQLLIEDSRRWDRELFANRYGAKLLKAMQNDNSSLVQSWLKTSDPEQLLILLLSRLEGTVDPTLDKEFMPWITRMYSRGDMSIEDFDLKLLQNYDIARRRKLLKQNDSDIDNFSSYAQFANEMRKYNFENMFDTPRTDRGRVNKVYNDDKVLIVHPLDIISFQRYTGAADWHPDLFQKYDPSTYIILVKNSAEKYMVDIYQETFVDRFGEKVEDPYGSLLSANPQIIEYFVNNVPGAQDYIPFAPESVIRSLLKKIKEYVDQYIWEETSDWEAHDEYYHDYIREKYLSKDDDDDDDDDDDWAKIDWDEVYKNGDDYFNYNDQLRNLIENIDDCFLISLEELGELSADGYNDISRLDRIESLMAIYINQKNYDNHMNVPDFLLQKVIVYKSGDVWDVKLK